MLQGAFVVASSRAQGDCDPGGIEIPAFCPLSDDEVHSEGFNEFSHTQQSLAVLKMIEYMASNGLQNANDICH